MAVAFNKFNSTIAAFMNKVHNLGADTIKIILTNTAPVAGNTQYSNITELAAGNGYTTGGITVTVSSSSQTAGAYKYIVTNPSPWTATGAMGPFRYVVMYNFTATNKELLGYWDYGSSITLNNTETFTVTFDGTNGVIQAS